MLLAFGTAAAVVGTVAAVMVTAGWVLSVWVEACATVAMAMPTTPPAALAGRASPSTAAWALSRSVPGATYSIHAPDLNFDAAPSHEGVTVIAKSPPPPAVAPPATTPPVQSEATLDPEPTPDRTFVTASIEPTVVFKPPAQRAMERETRIPLPPLRPKLTTARPEIDVTPAAQASNPADARTAVYDIEARMVYLPSGRKLEAHSGLGAWMDDPRSIRRKNRGATPPNTYELALRTSLFHGVQAIRMNPVDEDSMFGRDGILAHPYMLGPSGQSNGCVSFKDYQAFLRAFLKGEVDRIVVVPRHGAERFARLHGRPVTKYALDNL